MVVRRGLRFLLIVAAALLLVVALTLLRPSDDTTSGFEVTGERHFDFGEQTIDGPVELKHVFALKNELTIPLRLKRVVTTCGCTKAQPSADIVPAGDRFEVEVTLKLAAAGTRREQVHLILDENDDPITLYLQATARVRDSFYCQHRAVLLMPGHLTTVVAIQQNVTDEPPLALTVAAPAGVRATASEWTRVTHAVAATRQPSRWHANVMLEIVDYDSIDGGTVTVKDGLGRIERIGLDGFPAG
jgi:hypothetical protein